MSRLMLVAAVSLCMVTGSGAAAEEGTAFPVAPELFVDEPFRGCEGIAFNGEGRLFVTCNQAFWEVTPDGQATKLVELDSKELKLNE